MESDLDDEQAQAIKVRLMDRVADEDISHVTVHAAEGAWQPFLPGVRMKPLRERDGVLSYLLSLDPGATIPAHRHPHDEECIVVEGSVRIGTTLAVGAGGYHLAPAGALHATLTTETGAVLFLRGAIPEADHVLA